MQTRVEGGSISVYPILEPIIEGIPVIDIPQNSIYEKQIKIGAYIKSLELVNNNTCSDSFDEISSFEAGENVFKLCEERNSGNAQDPDHPSIAPGKISEREIAGNSYIKNVEIVEVENGGIDCSQNFIKKSDFWVSVSKRECRPFGLGWCDPERHVFQLCVEYNNGPISTALVGVPKNSISEYHIAPDTYWEDLYLSKGDCRDDGDWREVGEFGVLGVDFRLCADYNDDDIGVGTVSEEFCVTEIIDKSVLGDSGISARGYCVAKDPERFCSEIGCEGDLRCFTDVNCDYSSYDRLGEGIALSLTCCLKPAGDFPEEIGEECVNDGIEDGTSLEVLRNKCPNVCELFGTNQGWTDDQKLNCKEKALELINEMDEGKEQIDTPRLGEGIGPPSSRSEECVDLGESTGQATQSCIGCCGEGTGIAHCCYLDIEESGIGCTTLWPGVTYIEDLGNVVIEYDITLGEDKIAVYLDSVYDGDVPIDGYRIIAGRLGDSDTFAFIDRAGIPREFESDLTKSCRAIVGDISLSSRCYTTANELSPSSPDLRVSCKQRFGEDYVLTGVIINNIDNNDPVKNDFEAICCLLTTSFI